MDPRTPQNVRSSGTGDKFSVSKKRTQRIILAADGADKRQLEVEGVA